MKVRVQMFLPYVVFPIVLHVLAAFPEYGGDVLTKLFRSPARQAGSGDASRRNVDRRGVPKDRPRPGVSKVFAFFDMVAAPCFRATAFAGMPKNSRPPPSAFPKAALLRTPFLMNIVSCDYLTCEASGLYIA